MFTGIVECMGDVLEFSQTGANDGWILKIRPEKIDIFFGEDAVRAGEMYIGASICVSGVCLTVIAFDKDSFTFNVAPETLRKTAFGDLKPAKSKVNLERAAKVNARNSGHSVQGHVDNVGKILEITPEKDSLWFKIQLPEDLMPHVAVKGYIAIEGTSLTVCEVNREKNWFTVMLIDHTQKCIVLPLHKVGDRINIEVDILSKYSTQSNEDLLKVVKELSQQVQQLTQRVQKMEDENNDNKKKMKPHA